MTLKVIRKLSLVAIIVPIALALLPTGLMAGTYVSFTGEFSISYPEPWSQVDYRTADYFISGAGNEANYEAVFASKDSGPVFQGEYLILTVDTTGPLTAPQMDSVLAGMKKSFKRDISEVAPEALISPDCKRVITFNREQQILAVASAPNKNSESSQMNLMALRFYEKGIAGFYFYAPDSLFEASLSDFQQIFASFSTENLDEAMNSEPARVADIEKRRGDSGGGGSVALIVGLIIVLAAVAYMVVKRRA